MFYMPVFLDAAGSGDAGCSVVDGDGPPCEGRPGTARTAPRDPDAAESDGPGIPSEAR